MDPFVKLKAWGSWQSLLVRCLLPVTKVTTSLVKALVLVLGWEVWKQIPGVTAEAVAWEQGEKSQREEALLQRLPSQSYKTRFAAGTQNTLAQKHLAVFR